MKKCTKCGRELSEENFRVHKSGFVLNQCKECEREASRARSKKSTFELVTTTSGVAYKASLTDLGGRKVTSPNTAKVLYLEPGVSRDVARNLFANWAGVPYTGISVK